jgi:hypothetical protein
MLSRNSRDGDLFVAEVSPNPGRSSAAVEDRTNTNDLTFHAVIDGKGKALTQTSMVCEDRSVNSAMRSQKVDISEQRIEKISAQAGSLTLIETETRDEIALRVREDFDPHEVCRRISSFVFSQSTNFASPDATRASRTRNSSLCQAGESIASGFADKFSQMASMVWSFSSMLISSSGRAGIAIADDITALRQVDD